MPGMPSKARARLPDPNPGGATHPVKANRSEAGAGLDTTAARYQEAVTAQAAGDHAGAAHLYRQVLAVSPRHPQAQNNLGTALFAMGRAAEAIACFQAAVAAAPAYTEALANLGKILAMGGQWRQALPVLQAARRHGASDDDTKRALILAARSLAQASMGAAAWAKAKGHWQTVLQLVPGDADAAYGLAQALHAEGDLVSASSLYEQLVAASPGRDDAWTNLGALREALGDAQGAEMAYRAAWEQAPGNLAAGFNLGRLLVDQGAAADGLRILQAVAAAAPADSDVQLALATALAAVNDLTGAEALCQQLIASGPSAERAWLTLGNIRQAADQLDGAAEAYAHAVGLRPDYVPAWRNLGSVRMAVGKIDEAATAFAKAQQLQFDPGIAFREALMLPPLPPTATAIRAARKRYQRGLERLRDQQVSLSDPLTEVGSTSFYLAYHGVNDRQLQLDTAKLYLQACPSLGWTAPHIGEVRPAGGKLRIGFASAFLRRHTIGRLYGQFIARLDRSRFEVWVFQTPGDDPLASEIAAAADHHIVLTGDLAAMRVQIAGARLDALIYPDIGMEPTSYFLAFARLATVQAVLWGHPMTTGIPNVDYFLSAAAMETPSAQAHYSEDVVCLPSVNTFFRRPEPPQPGKDRSDLGLPETGGLYVCPQSLFKFHPDFDRACMAILDRDPTGTLVLLQDSARHWQDILQQRFETLSPTAARRVRFLPRLNESDFFSLLRSADVLLDPIHFGGGNTTLEAFAMGTPVVTLPSDYLRGRITYALYQQMGMDDLIATDATQFVALATAVVADPAWRQALSDRIVAAWPTVFERDEAVQELADFLTEACEARGRRLGKWAPPALALE
jgi:protein O-GlcNAc transferase